MLKLLNKKVIGAVVALLVAIAGTYGYTVSTETQAKIETIAVEKLETK
jgi:hypothetical protein